MALDTRGATNETLIIEIGGKLDSNNATFTVVDQNGAARDMSGYDGAVLTIWEDETETTELLSFDAALGELVLANGSFYLNKNISAESLVRGIYYYEMHVIIDSANDPPRTIMWGPCWLT